MRSILEHNIDMHYLALENKPGLNRQFFNYYRLLLYWERNRIEYYKEIIPWTKEQYQEYVYQNFPDIAKTAKSKELILTASEFDKAVKWKYMRSWSGLDFSSRVDRVHKLLSQKFPDRLKWDDTPKRRGFEFYFGSYSNYTHPSPFSVLPNLAPRLSDYDLDYVANSSIMESCEEGLILAADYCIRAYADALPMDEREGLDALYDKCLGESQAIKAYFDS